VLERLPSALVSFPGSHPRVHLVKTAILGAGVSGLSLARFLVEGGLDASDVHLFEAGARPGGLCASKTVDGFTYDVTGGHILYSKDAQALAWMKDKAGGDAAFERRDRHTRIRFGQRWVNYPFENGLGDLPPEACFDCLSGYVQAWHRRQVDGSPAPESFGQWVRWRFGDGIARHFMDPYNEKVWKRPLDHLTSDWVAGRVPDAPVDDVLRSAIGIRTEGYTHQASFYYPRRGGFQAITDGIASTLGPRIRLSTPVTEVEKRGAGWRVNGEDFDAVVNTVSLTHLPRFVRGLPAEVADACRALEYNGIVCVLLALERREHPDLSWIYLPHPAQGPANRVTYMSNYAEGLAPAGRTSLLCEVTVAGGARFPGAELEREIVEGLASAGLIRRGEVLFHDRTETEQAYVVFDHGYARRRATVLGWIEQHGLVTLGRFGRFEYDNSDQCVIKARQLALALLARVRA
jgi:protoporphyrinogen oxidase